MPMDISRIFLVGYMYSGKSTVGNLLAQQLGYSFIDLDQAFEQRYHTHITLFFQRYGEAAFRQLESVMLRSITDSQVVVATGGGTPCYHDNMDYILTHGTAVYLQLTTDELCERVAHASRTRPLLAHLQPAERATFVGNQLRQREAFYNRAQIKIAVHTTPVVPLVNTIVSRLSI